MTEITIDTTDLGNGLNAISKQLNIQWEEKCNFYTTNFVNDSGSGNLSCFDLSNGKGIVIVEATFFNDLQINLNYEALKSPFKIIFNLGDPMLLNVGKEENKLKKNQYAINMVSPKSGYTASLNAGSKIKFVVFFIYNSEFFESLICDIESSVEKTVLTEGMSEDGMYSSTESMSLQLIEAMNKTLLNNLEGIEQRLFLEGQFSTILSLLLLDKKPDNAEKSFTTEEAKLINLVKTTLDQEFVNSPTIKELAKKVGTNTNKLHKLFKGAFDTTINKYVLNKKMEMGRGLLLGEDITIAEISNKVGIENPSYFSKQFKLHYNLLPSEYKKNNG
jgi:AraC-like DNA-binding protein